MDRSKKIVQAFLNSGEGYYHCRQILEDGKVKRQFDKLLKPGYKYIRDISKKDLIEILVASIAGLDKELYQKIPSTALHATLGNTVWSYKDGTFQAKIDSNIYNILYKILEISTGKEGNNHE